MKRKFVLLIMLTCLLLTGCSTKHKAFIVNWSNGNSNGDADITLTVQEAVM